MRISDWSSDVCSSDLKLDAIPIRSRLICESARSGKRVDLIHLIDVALAGDARRDRRCRAHPEALVDLDADMAGVGLGAQLEGLVEEDLRVRRGHEEHLLCLPSALAPAGVRTLDP